MFSFLFCCPRGRFLFVCAVWIICSVLHIACLAVCLYSLNYVLLCLVLAVCFHLFHEFIHLLCPHVCSILSFFVRGPGSSCDLTALSTNIFDLNLYLSYVQFCFIVVVWCVCVYAKAHKSILRCAYFISVSFVLISLAWLDSLAFCLFCLVVLRSTKLDFGTQSYGIRVRPRTHHDPHGGSGPWKHLLARSGFVVLVPVVVRCFFGNECGSLRFR